MIIIAFIASVLSQDELEDNSLENIFDDVFLTFGEKINKRESSSSSSVSPPNNYEGRRNNRPSYSSAPVVYHGDLSYYKTGTKDQEVIEKKEKTFKYD